MDARFKSATVKPLSPLLSSANGQKVLGVKLSTDDELIAQTSQPEELVDMTVVTACDVLVYKDLQVSLTEIRTSKP